MSLETSQNRFQYTKLDTVGYNAYLADYLTNPVGGTPWTITDHLQAQGLASVGAVQMSLENNRDGSQDPTSGENCLYINNDSESSNPGFTKDLTSLQWQNAFNFGFEVRNSCKVLSSTGGSADAGYKILAGWSAEQDPRASGVGVAGSLSVWGGCDVQSPDSAPVPPTVYQWGGVGMSTSHSVSADNKMHKVVWRVAPKIDDTTWGLMELEIDGVVVESGIDWVSPTSSPHFALSAGSSVGSYRKSKHVYCQLAILGDSRNYKIPQQGFDINVVGGVGGSTPISIEIPTSAKGAAGCSIVEVLLTGPTQVSISAETGTIDGSTSPLVINAEGVGTVRRIFITKDSPEEDYLVTQLNVGG